VLIGRNPRCLVTGAAGFIGSHVVERLVESGHRVIGVDNLETGRLANLAPVAADARFDFEELDINSTDELVRCSREVDWFFHLAALADIVPSIQKPLRYHRSNVDGTVSALEAARANQAHRFVYAASSSCYGIPNVYPTPETAPIQPMYPYALTKYLGEQYVLHWHRTYGLPAVSLRLFNVYGPRARTSGTYGAVFGVFLAQKIAGRPYTVVGDGTQTRDFTYVTDVADAFVCAAASDLDGAVLNVGSGGTYSINELVSLLGGEVLHIPKRPGEPDSTFADITQIKNRLGWQAKIPFQEGVELMLDRLADWSEAPLWDEDSIAEATKEWFLHLGKTRETKAEP
jgi:UDP-glucose 4-epimerase